MKNHVKRAVRGGPAASFGRLGLVAEKVSGRIFDRDLEAARWLSLVAALCLPAQGPFVVYPTGDLVLTVVTDPYHPFTGSGTES